MKKSYNRWKIAFFLLLVPVIVVLFIIASLLFSFFSYNSFEHDVHRMEQKKTATYFTIKTTKSELNDFFSKKLTGNYSIRLENDYGILSTSVSILSINIPTELIFIPEKKENGNLRLKIHDIKLAGFRLPEEQVLHYIKETIQFPNFVEIDPVNQLINIFVTEVQVAEGLFLYVDEFNLMEDEIVFTLISKAGES